MLGPSTLLAAIRDSPNERAAIAAIAPELAGHRYLLLTTFKRDGTPVATPVWFAAQDGRLVFASQADAWKIKRLRREPRAIGTGCDARGTPEGPSIELIGEVLDPSEHAAANRALDRRYGVSSIGFRLAMQVVGRGARDYATLRPTPVTATTTNAR